MISRLMRIKFYINRSATYLSLINLGMIFFLFLSGLKDKGYIDLDIGKLYFPIIVISIIIFGIIGWIEVVYLRGFTEEAKFSLENDVIHKEILDRLKRIEEAK